MQMPNMSRMHRAVVGATLSVLFASLAMPDLAKADVRANPPGQCARTLTADIVAIDMPLMWNRLGAQNVNGMMFALRRDVINLTDKRPLTAGGAATPGNVALRPDKRPRPLVLHSGKGDCIDLKLTNLLTPAANPFNAGIERSKIPFNILDNDAVAERRIGLRFQGTELKIGIKDDASNVGMNPSSGLVAPGDSVTYKIHTPLDGAFIGESMGATVGGEGQGGHTPSGLWAVLTVNSPGSAFYRSQIAREEMDLATAINLTPGHPNCGKTNLSATKHPIVNYEAIYPSVNCDGTTTSPWVSEGKAGLPVINMVHNGELVHSELNAVVAYGPSFSMAAPQSGPHSGRMGHFPPSAYALESSGYRNPTVPNRLEPFREFTVAFHDEVATQNAFPLWFDDPVLGHTLHGVRDSFMINYGSGGIGSEIIASRLRVGPMHDCIGCAYEEFFLAFSAVGEVGQLVDIPANFGLERCKPDLTGCAATGPKATYALYPDDPSNVHHSYQDDATAFRNLHAGGGEQHVFHLHNHQWLFNAADDNSNYLDAQGLGPGSGYAYWINFGGAGNRNKSAGDAIFHCHFYPHFAQGMWEMWRVHDTFEQGTQLQTTLDGGGAHISFVNDGIGLGKGKPAADSRALPDGEILAGVPIPAVVPLPGKPMAPMPPDGVTVKDNPNSICVGNFPLFGLKAKVRGVCPVDTTERPTGSLADVPRVDTNNDGVLDNPGYPFWIAGIEHTVGQRPPTPPLDMMNSARAQKLKDTQNPLWQHPGFADAASIQGWDGGLPRFTLDGYSAGSKSIMALTRMDFSKEIHRAKPFFFPEEGTDLEQAAMRHHSKRCHDTFLPNGDPAPCADENGIVNTVNKSLNVRKGFVTNGALPVPGAPFFEPCVDDRGKTLTTGIEGRFFGGKLATMDDVAAMDRTGKSPFSADKPRVYKAANVQFDAVFNKLGYHFPQERILTLWQDVAPTIQKQRPPEPLVLRMNTFDCTTYVHSNVVPKAYELDDYQVRSPTDIIGQHIHLPKWDLVSADGAANGWNYEDGTLSPEAVVEVIEAINRWQNESGAPVYTYSDPAVGTDPGVKTSSYFVDPSAHPALSASNFTLHPADHPFFGGTPYAVQWKGARSTIQRWFADPVVNVQGVDRGLGIIFTHDHFGPSTHQQIGLYATVLIEPAGSKWVHNETGTQLYTRTGPDPSADGGPTSWQAAILTGTTNGIGGYSGNVGWQSVESYREFYLEYSDFQHAYQPGVYIGAGADGQRLVEYGFSEGPELSPGLFLNGAAPLTGNSDSFRDAIQPSVRLQAPLVNGFPKDIWVFPPSCPGGVIRPCPEAISADDPGMYVVNYRNESLIARVFDPNRTDCPAGQKGCQAFGPQGDLAMAMVTNVTRAIPELNQQLGKAPLGYKGGGTSPFLPPINQLSALAVGDPFTPMMRTYDGDNIHVKVQAGGHEEEHTLLLHGLKWLQAGSGFGEAKNSGWRNAQPGGISEQFSFRMPIYSDYSQRGSQADYAYVTANGFDGWATGVWGIIRSYANGQNNLFKLPNNDVIQAVKFVNGNNFNKVCPKTLPDGKVTPQQDYDITAVLAEDVLDVPKNGNGESLVKIQDLFPDAHMGRAPDSKGGTLVFNSRTTEIPGVEAGEPSHRGPLHDPAGILYVKTSDLVADNEAPYPGAGDRRCWTAPTTGTKWKYTPWLPTCPVHLKPEVPVEPLVIRAAAGDCINVTLRNKTLEQAVTKIGNWPIYNDLGKPVFLDIGDKSKGLSADTNGDGIGDTAVTWAQVKFDSMPDLAVGNPLPAIVRLKRDDPQGMTSVQSNLLTPSPFVGLHPALVEYDVTRSDGTEVGQNNGLRSQTAGPGEQVTYQWYAGHISAKASSPGSRNYTLVATPIEFGGFNLMPADKIEQPQHGLVGAGVVYPQGATWTVDAGTTTSATVTEPASGGLGPWVFRDFSIVAQKGVAMFYSDSSPVHNLEGEGTFGVAEDSQDMGGMTINYGAEPMWFRFGQNPAGHGVLHNVAAGEAYTNALGGGDPQTAVFTAMAGQPVHMHVLMPTGAGRGSTFDLHGHVWHRDPYVCNSTDLGIPGKCNMGNGVAGAAGTGEVGSRRIAGTGQPGEWRYENRLGMSLGGIESWFPGEHYEVVLPSAGGSSKVTGDYLFRDHMGKGNASGLWGILRVKK